VQGKLVWMTSLVVPIMVDDVFYGITGVDLRLDFMQALAEGVNREFYGGAGRLAVVSHNGILTAVSDQAELVGKSLQSWLPEK
jgi:methyl-accepting chemotaxis protein